MRLKQITDIGTYHPVMVTIEAVMVIKRMAKVFDLFHPPSPVVLMASDNDVKIYSISTI
jgi:hypothetical protein